MLANSRTERKLQIKEKIWLNSTRVMCFFITSVSVQNFKKKTNSKGLSTVKLGKLIFGLTDLLTH